MNNTEQTATLVVDDRRWGQILVNQQPVRLQEKQFRLIRLLARHPGECIPYGEIYADLWGDLIVETNQMHFQKKELLQRVRAVVPEYGSLVTSVSKRGFVLNLGREQVRVL